MDTQLLTDIVLNLLPPIGMAVLVYFLFKAIIGADAKERKVRAEVEAEERAKLAKSKSIKGN